MADDFVKFRFGLAAAESERSGEMFPVIKGKAVKFAGDKGFERRAFTNVARVFQKFGGGIGEFLENLCFVRSILIKKHHVREFLGRIGLP